MKTMELDEDEKICLQYLETSAEKLDGVGEAIGAAIEKGGRV